MRTVYEGTPVIYMDRETRGWWVVAMFHRNVDLTPDGLVMHERPRAPLFYRVAQAVTPEPETFRVLHLRPEPLDIPDLYGVVRRWHTLILRQPWQA